MITIPMAGDSSRFKLAGYALPKFMLQLEGRTLFEWTLLSFRRYFESENFVFIARENYESLNFIETSVRKLGIKNFHVVYLSNATSGQAETVKKGLDSGLDCQFIYPSDSLVIFNIDTIRPNIKFPVLQGDMAWLEVFSAPGDGWSFVEPKGASNLVKRCEEKKRISDLCSTGLYGFKSVEQFMLAYQYEFNNRSSTELFVAPLYNHIIRNGENVAWTSVDDSQVLLSGVPREYEALKNIQIQRYFD